METVIKFSLNFGHYDYRIKGYQWTHGAKLFDSRRDTMIAAAEYVGSFADANAENRLIITFDKVYVAEEGDAE